MPADLYIDRMETVNASFERGVARSCTRKCRVILREEVSGQEGYLSLGIARTFMRSKGFIEMQPMAESPVILDEDKVFAPLVLTKMDLAIVEGDKYCVDVTLHYAHVLDGSNQEFGINGPANGILWGKGRTSIVEKTTNFFYPYGDRTRPRIQLEVGHQFESTDIRMIAVNHDPRFPRYIIQGGEITIPFPQMNYKWEAVVSTAFPARLAGGLIARINSVPWMGMPACTWLISEVAWEVNDPSRLGAGKIPTYKMGFEFQYNVDTWNPTVAFKDKETGNIPAKAVKAYVKDSADPDDPKGVLRYQELVGLANIDEPLGLGGGFGRQKVPAGYWEVPALERIDFVQTFKAIFEATEA